jgi:hypothetical protein
MNGIQILERIITEEGNCCWAKPSICRDCPLGRLERYDNGGYMSCVEALNIDGLSEIEADARYKAAALDKLTDLNIEKTLGE